MTHMLSKILYLCNFIQILNFSLDLTFIAFLVYQKYCTCVYITIQLFSSYFCPFLFAAFIVLSDSRNRSVVDNSCCMAFASKTYVPD